MIIYDMNKLNDNKTHFSATLAVTIWLTKHLKYEFEEKKIIPQFNQSFYRSAFKLLLSSRVFRLFFLLPIRTPVGVLSRFLCCWNINNANEVEF